MQLLKTWLHLTMLLLWDPTACRSQNAAIQHLNMKFNRLNRITNGLLRDVDDLWTALSNAVVQNSDKGIPFSNQTDEGHLNAEEVLKLVNGKVSDVKELKTEVEKFVVYAQKGLKNEKAFSRKVIKGIQTSQHEFEIKVRNDVAVMKIWLQNLEQTQKQTLDDMLDNFRSKIVEDHKILLENIHNKTSNSEAQLEEHKLEIQECNDKLETVKQKLDSTEKHNADEIALIKQVINEKLGHVASCSDGWTSFGEHCYFFSSDTKTWDDALDFCHHRESHIVEITKEAKVNFLVQNSKASYSAHYSIWVGANDRKTEGTFVWQTSNTSVPNHYFCPGEPNNSNGNENCVELYWQTDRVNKLNDANCERTKYFVCEKSKFIFL